MIMWLMSTAETLIFVAPVFGRLAGCSIEWNCAPDSTKAISRGNFRDRSSAMEAETNFAVDSRILQLRSSAASSSLCSTRNEPRISS
jgi:hypothetical protein